jgi:hypothetical protein
MISVIRWGGALFGLALAFPAAIPAQTQPMPGLPSELEAEQPARSFWDYSLGLGESWLSNLTPGGPYDFATIGRARIEGDQVRPGRELRLSAEGEGRAYALNPPLNRIDWRFGFDGQFRLSRRTAGALALGFDYGHSDTSTVLVDQVIYVPLTRTRGYSAVADVRHRVNPGLTLRAAARAYRMDFPDSDVFRDSTSLRFTGGVNRAIGPRNTVGLEYSAGLTDQAELIGLLGGSLWTHYQSLQWSHTLSPRAAFLVEGGVSYSPSFSDGGLQRSWDYFGGVSVSRKLRRSSLGAFYRREVLPAFGVRVAHLANRVGFSVDVPIGLAYLLDFRAFYGREVQQGPQAYDPQSVSDASFKLVRAFGRRLRGTIEGRYRHQSAPGFLVSSNDYRAALIFTVVPARAGRTRL